MKENCAGKSFCKQSFLAADEVTRLNSIRFRRKPLFCIVLSMVLSVTTAKMQQ